jgi:hypothetical protein
MMRVAPWLCVTWLVTGPVQAGIPNPLPVQMRQYTAELDQLEKTFFFYRDKGDQFGEAFWQASKRVAKRNSPDIIAAVMLRARKWTDEEGLIFVSLVSLLPRRPTLAILHAYEHSSRESDRVWANEFMIEFEADDTKESTQRYSR